MKRILIFLLSLTVFFSCRDNRSTSEEYFTDTIPSNNIRNYLVRVSHEITENSLKEIENPDYWKKIRPDRKREMIEMLGLQNYPLKGERGPLHMNVTGTLQEDGYHIDKLSYQSIPGLYVEANLYVPDRITDPRPGVLYLCGHARDMKVHYQPHPHKFAQLGFVCLIVETIQYGEVWGEHWGEYARGWFHWYSRGYTPAGVEVWNAIRGLDLLESLPYVDKDKLGVTGISGGGAITWFTAAVDDRVKAAAPVCGASTVEAQICTRTIDGHCDCMMPVNSFGWDFQDIGALIAPVPLLIGQADRDGLNKVESVREIYHGLQKIYNLYGVPDNVVYVETPGGHSYHKISREAIFSFFMDHLMNKKVSPDKAGDIDDSPESQLSEKELKVYVNGPPGDDITKTIQDSFIKLPSPPEIHSMKELTAYRDSVKTYLMKNTFHAFPSEPCDLQPEMVFRTLDDAAYGMNIYHIRTERDWDLRLKILWRNPKSEKKPLMLVLRNPDEEKGDSEAFISDLDPEWNIAFFDTRGVGESGWSPALQWHIRRASAWTGRTIASMRVYDVLRCLDFCRSLAGINPDSVGLAARGEMGTEALYAALLDGRCSELVLKDPPDTQNKASRPDGRGEAIEMLNCLRITDVNQIPALIYPAQVSFISRLPETYEWAQNVLQNLEAGTIRVYDNVSGIH